MFVGAGFTFYDENEVVNNEETLLTLILSCTGSHFFVIFYDFYFIYLFYFLIFLIGL